MKKQGKYYWYRRCYFRGWSWLGLFNTVMGCLFNRVLVHAIDHRSGKTVSWYWNPAHWWGPAPDHVTFAGERVTIPSSECIIGSTMLLVPFRFNRGGFDEYAYCEMDEIKALDLLKRTNLLTFEINGDKATIVGATV